MHKLIVTLQLQPGQLDEFLARLGDGSAAKAAQGCLSYEVFIDRAEVKVVAITGWSTKADLDAYLASPKRLNLWVPLLPMIVPDTIEQHIYEVALQV